MRNIVCNFSGYVENWFCDDVIVEEYVLSGMDKIMLWGCQVRWVVNYGRYRLWRKCLFQLLRDDFRHMWRTSLDLTMTATVHWTTFRHRTRRPSRSIGKDLWSQFIFEIWPIGIKYEWTWKLHLCLLFFVPCSSTNVKWRRSFSVTVNLYLYITTNYASFDEQFMQYSTHCSYIHTVSISG